MPSLDQATIDLTAISDAGLDALVARIAAEKEARHWLNTAQAETDNIAQLYRQAADRNVPPGQTPAWTATSGLFPVGCVVSYNSVSYRCQQTHRAQGDWTPDKTPSLWVVVPPAGSNAWVAGAAYAVGAQVTYGGKTYTCQQGHTSQVGWEPPNVPALWQEVVAPGSAPPPVSGAKAWATGTVYKAGDTVLYKSKTYTCLQGHTSQVGWEPDAVPSLWKVS